MEVSDILRLNVSGEIREISRATLEKIPVFEYVLNSEQCLLLPNDELFIDRDVDLFDEMIAFVNWEITPTLNALYEIEDYYGLLIGEEHKQSDLDRIQSLSAEFAERLQSPNNTPYYINTCGKVWVTTKDRLKKIGYFRGLFNEDLQMKQLYAGTKSDPYRCEIPSAVFGNILQHLRTNRVELLDSSQKVLNVLGGIVDANREIIIEPRLTEHVTEIDNAGGGMGALMDLVATGPADVALNGNSQITIWKSAHRRVTKTSTNRTLLCSEKKGQNSHVVKIVRNGDLIYQCYIRFKVMLGDKIYNVSELIARDTNLAYKLISTITLEIGGQRIDRLDGYQLMMLSKMHPTSFKTPIIESAILGHLPLCFCMDTIKHTVGKALPLISLQYHEVVITIETRDNVLPTNLVIIPDLYVSYTYLDSEERRDFAQNSREYLLPLYHSPQVFNREEANVIKCRLYLHHPTRAIYFTLHSLQDNPYHPLTDGYISHTFSLNGQVRHKGNCEVAYLDRKDSNVAQDVPIFIIPFALDVLDDTQPTMSCNMSRVDVITLNIFVEPHIRVARVWGSYWNFLRCASGMAGLTYAT